MCTWNSERTPALLVTRECGILDLRNQNGNSRSWANSLLHRSSFVKRKATKFAKKVPPTFDKDKIQFLDLLSTTIAAHQIPEELVINIDETSLVSSL